MPDKVTGEAPELVWREEEGESIGGSLLLRTKRNR